MARVNRRDVLADGEVQVVHCVNRCVRRALLCGDDPLTGKNYDHRRQWIRNRLEFLAGVFGVEVLSFAVMSNHFHVVLKTRPDAVTDWTDEEVARRWWRFFPQRRYEDGLAADPSVFELRSLHGDKTKLAELRKRLSSVSWLIRCTSEVVVRLANALDECTGRFWQGCFRALVLLDEAAILACMQYLDLNPVRANMAKTPEKSDFTSALARLLDLLSASEVEGQAPSSALRTPSPPKGRRNAIDKCTEHGPQASWIAPVALDAKRKAVRNKSSSRRASNNGCLPIQLGDYLLLLDWTRGQIRNDKPGAVPNDLQPIFERLGISTVFWVGCVVNFRKWFRCSVGRPKSMEANAKGNGHRRAVSITSSRHAFA